MSAKKKPVAVSEPAKEPAKVVASKPVASAIPSKPVADFFDKLGNKGPLLCFGLILLVGFLVFKDYLLFEKAYYFKDIGSDSENYLYPVMYNNADQFARFGIPKWSFAFGMGQNIFPFFFRDPFDIFIYLAGKNHVAYGTIYKELFKIILGGIIFYYYLRSLKLSDFTSLTGSLLYAFCSFTILGSGWQIFTFEAFNMALMLLAFEQLFQKNKWYLFPPAILLISISQPFNLYMYGLFLATYAILRQFQVQNFTWKNTGSLFLKMAGLGLIGMMLGSPFMIEIIFQMLESPRGSGTNSLSHILSATPMFSLSDPQQFGTCIMRFFSSDILGCGSDFKGWSNYLEAPMFYCGIPCLVLLPQIFPFLEKKVRTVFIIFLAIWVMPIMFPYFRRAFWLFSGDYYRAYSFFVAFFFIYYSLKALEYILEKQKINFIILIVTVIALFGLLNYPYFEDKETVNSAVYSFVSVAIIIYAALLFFMGKPGSSPFLKYAFFIFILLELSYLSGITVNDRQAVTAEEFSQKFAYNDYTVEAVNYLKKTDKSFYRLDKTYASTPAIHYSLNDGLAQDYYGTSGYSPFNQVNYIRYLQLMGISNKANELESRWANGLSYRPILESGNSVKYILAKTKVNHIWKITCDSLATFGDVKVFRNKFVIPFGYTYSNYVKESDFENISAVQKDFLSLKVCAVKDADIPKISGLKEFPLKDTMPESSFSGDFYRQEVNELSRDTMVVSKFENNFISGTINASDNKMMYLSVPFDAGWKLKVDGQPQDKIILDGGMTGVMLKKGHHTIEMAYELRYFMKGVYLCILGLLIYLALFFVIKKRSSNIVA